ncbi:unnamed protein product [Musa acuminata subsp. burmannicoides]
MAFHNHLSHELTLPQYAEEQLGGDSPTVLMTTVGQLAASTSGAATEAKDGKDIPRLMAEGSGPTWLNSAILRRQGHHYADGSFLHLQTTVDSSSPPVAAGGGGGGLGHWFPRPPTLRRSGSEDEAPVSSDSVMVAAIPAGGEFVEAEALAQRTGGEAAAGEGTWQSARYKAEILAHPLYEQLLSAHVACVRIATPVDQLPRIDAQLAQSQQVVSKYSVLGGGGSSGQILGDGKELDRFMTHYVLLLCSFKEQLQQHVRVHAMEAVMACWELEQALQSLTGVSPGEGTGATMSDDDDDDQVDSETNLLDGSLDGPDSMGFGPLVPTDSERSLMERVRQELKHELKQGYKEKIVDVREEILRKRRAGKLPGDSTCQLKAWWQSHSKWPYPTEDDKAQLVEETGLQLKQINNWFINQRKRNWHTNPSSSSSLKSKRKRVSVADEIIQFFLVILMHKITLNVATAVLYDRTCSLTIIFWFSEESGRKRLCCLLDREGKMAQVPPQPQAAVPGPAEGGGGAQFSSTSLYVGDLDPGVTDAQLYDVFSQIGAVVSVRVCRDMNTRFSLGYAYVNYNDAADGQLELFFLCMLFIDSVKCLLAAARALEVLNFMPLNGKTIRIMHSNRDPSTRRSGTANIFIKNLDKCIDNKALYDTFSAFGNILSCKVATDASGQSKGYGFVQFEQDDAAQNAIENLNGMLLNDKKVFVGPFIRKQERENAASNITFSNVFVKNLSESTTEDTLQEVFGEFGKITSCIVMRGEDGKSKCFGFVNFENPDEAAQAVQELNGKKFDDKEWYVGRAQKKSEREQELKEKFDQSKQESSEKLEGVNLYLKNLDDNIGDDNLRELFSGFGAIASCKVVVRDKNGVSKGSGFVVFQSPDHASQALLEMNGKMIGNKPLYVALAQRKEDRRARLQAQFSQMRPVVMPPSVAPRVPLYPPGAPGLGQPLFYGQPPALVPPQPGFGFPHPLVTGMRPGAAPFPNFFIPMAQQGQQAQRPGGRRAGAGPLQLTQQHPMQMIQQQMLPRGGRPYRYPPGRGMPEVGNPEGMFSPPYDMGGMPARHAGMSQPVPVGELTSALANATPEQQRLMLGESLYPLVDQLEHGYAAKVTGMLLEMDQNEVLHLLESPEALQAKVVEAMGVLRSVVQQQQVANRLAGLSLNDVS